nr:hypothetical protein [Sphingomonas sp.]
MRDSLVAQAGSHGVGAIYIKPEPASSAQAQIASVLELRRARAEVFGGDLFADPAWDILLQLYAASLGGRALRLSDLAAATPRSTVARWIALLEERALIACELDGFNAGELRIELAPVGEAKMSALFRETRHLQLIG